MKFAVTCRAVTVLGLLAMTTVPAFAEGSLSVMSFGGAYQEAQRMGVFKTCTAETGIKIDEQE
jgi:putative spermidine/putrescine transport system substrate-binding protein